MSIITKINALHGKCIDRPALYEMIRLAKEQEQPVIVARLRNILQDNPKDKVFRINITKPPLEVVPHSFLNCLECEDDQDDTIHGLGKAVSPDQVYQMMTDRMIQLVKEASAKDYVQKWRKRSATGGYLIPFNFLSKKAYRGINRFLLTGFAPLENPFFLTFNQVDELGGTVRKGAHGHEVVYFTQLYKYEQAEPKLSLASYDRNIFISMLKANAGKITLLQQGAFTPELLASQSALPILKYYNVFNGKDIDGIDFELDKFKNGYVEAELPAEKLPIAESIVNHYPETAPQINHGGQEAFYRPGTDKVQMPAISDFDTIQDYYRTLFHELAHSTGHGNRLDRKIRNKFGSKDYAFEELIAEFGAVFLSAEAGIIWHTDKNHAAYLANWNSALTHLKEDNRFFMRAATQAQKLTDYVLNLDKDGQPAYMADLKEVVEKQKAKQKKTKPADKIKPAEFVLSDLPAKYDRAIYSSSIAELNRHAEQSEDHLLKTAAQNMIFLLDNHLFDLLYFNEGYRRNENEPEYRNVPTVFRDLSTDDIKNLETPVQQYLFDKLKEYQYETAWLEYNFRGVSSMEIFKTVKSNIKRLEKYITVKPATEQLVLPLNGRTAQGLNGSAETIVCTENTEVADQKEIDAIETYEPVVVSEPISKNSKVRKIGASSDTVSEYYNIAGETGKFLQRVERKPKHSVVITLDGEQGAGKTTTLYQWMNDFAAPGNKCLFISGEEHPESDLAKQKVKKYITPTAQNNLDTVAEVDSIQELYELVSEYEIIFLDSWQKLLEMIGPFNLDKELRKKFDGKVFVIIFQQTTTGRAKGGAAVVFDGDIITKMVKGQTFSENYAYFNKNRYTLVPLETIAYNIATGTCYNPDETAEQEPEKIAEAVSVPISQKLKFTVS